MDTPLVGVGDVSDNVLLHSSRGKGGGEGRDSGSIEMSMTMSFCIGREGREGQQKHSKINDDVLLYSSRGRWDRKHSDVNDVVLLHSSRGKGEGDREAQWCQCQCPFALCEREGG